MLLHLGPLWQNEGRCYTQAYSGSPDLYDDRKGGIIPIDRVWVLPYRPAADHGVSHGFL